VVLVVRAHDHLGVGRVEGVPQGSHSGLVAVVAPRVEESAIEVGQGTLGGVGGEVVPEPAPLGRIGVAPPASSQLELRAIAGDAPWDSQEMRHRADVRHCSAW
jgi:hypothetical protein